MGDGNIHYNLNQPPNTEGKLFLAKRKKLNKIVHDIAFNLGGSISAEHGIGQLKRDELHHYKSAEAVDLMNSIKSTLDPNQIMNPGKIL